MMLNRNTQGGMVATTHLDANLERLSNMSLLEDNWNSYGAPKISPLVIDHVRSFLLRLPNDRQPDVAVPTGRGTVQLEYEDTEGKYLELDIGQSSIDVLYQPVDGDEIEEENILEDRAMDLIQRYYAE